MTRNKKLVVGAVVAGALTLGVVPAHADSNSVPSMAADSEATVCSVLGKSFTGDPASDGESIKGVAAGVVLEYNVTAETAMQVVNYSVKYYCPKLWPEMQAIGRNARAHDITEGVGK